MPAPMRSVMPVSVSAAEMTNTAATMMAGSLEKPESASLGVRMPVAAEREQRQHRRDVDADLLADEEHQRDGDDRQEYELFGSHECDGAIVQPPSRMNRMPR